MRMVFMVFIICKKLKRQCAVFVFWYEAIKVIYSSHDFCLFLGQENHMQYCDEQGT